jgi:hypothetical protein
MGLNVTPGGGATLNTDLVGGEHLPRYKPTHGAAGSATDVSAANQLPVRDPARGNALSKGGGTASASTQQLAAANGSRQIIEVSNGGSSGIWLAFGSAAVAGQGTYLPAKATGYWPTTAVVNYSLEASGRAGPVGFAEC